MIQPLWKMVQQVFIKLNMYLPNDPEILPLGIYPRDMKTYAKLKKPASKDYIIFHSIYKTFRKRNDCRNREQMIDFKKRLKAKAGDFLKVLLFPSVSCFHNKLLLLSIDRYDHYLILQYIS